MFGGRRLGGMGLAVMGAAVVGLGVPTAGSADTLSSTVALPQVVGACATGPLLGPMSMSVSSAWFGPPGPASVTIGGSATCVSDVGVSTMAVSLQGTIPFSCLVGTTYATPNVLTGIVNWSPSPPTQVSVMASVVEAADSIHLIITGGTLQAEANLEWLNPSVCNGSTVTTNLAGVFAFAWEA